MNGVIHRSGEISSKTMILADQSLDRTNDKLSISGARSFIEIHFDNEKNDNTDLDKSTLTTLFNGKAYKLSRP